MDENRYVTVEELEQSLCPPRSPFHEAMLAKWEAEEEITEVAGQRVKCRSGHPVATEQRCSACGQPYWVPIRSAHNDYHSSTSHGCTQERSGGAAVINKYG